VKRLVDIFVGLQKMVTCRQQNSALSGCGGLLMTVEGIYRTLIFLRVREQTRVNGFVCVVTDWVRVLGEIVVGDRVAVK
jgi:hypothetical protein